MTKSRSKMAGAGRCSTSRNLRELLDGDVSGSQVVAPGPGHSRKDRSLSVRLSPFAPDGFIVFSHAGDDWRVCRDFVRERSGLPREDRQRRPSEVRIRRPQARPEDDGRYRALTLWRRRQTIVGSVAERYLREARGYLVRSLRRSVFSRLEASIRLP